MKYTLGIDIGSSSVKIAVVENTSGAFIESAQHPPEEMPILSHEKSWAEQDPEMWWRALLQCLKQIDQNLLKHITHIGISYQMHGLVCVDQRQKVLRPSIIWCDSRAVEIGNKAFKDLGPSYCLASLLNSPGNFTASKLKWVKENEPEIYAEIDKIMLPGDYIAMKLSGKISTSMTGLSEGVFWDFKEDGIATKLLKHYGFDARLLPTYLPSFALHAEVPGALAADLGLGQGVRITYKAGDQPNNALSLNVLHPGEIAATAGTSGVVYGIVDDLFVDEEQRVNTFAHVNHSTEVKRLGVLLCINGVGISNAWVKKSFAFESYEAMNKAAKSVGAGAEGLTFYPFGNGAERMLSNQNLDASVEGLNFNIHSKAHFARAVQEGVAYSFAFGMEAFSEKEVKVKKIKAGYANMFLSDLFAQILSDLSNVDIELYNTDGAIGAARGALIGGKVLSADQAFSTLKMIKKITPSENSKYPELFSNWKNTLKIKIKNN